MQEDENGIIRYVPETKKEPEKPARNACKWCSETIPDGVNVCPTCKRVQNPDLGPMSCTNCNTTYGARVCQDCTLNTYYKNQWTPRPKGG
jgi:hypothetical protein